MAPPLPPATPPPPPPPGIFVPEADPFLDFEAGSSWLYNGGFGGGVGLDFTVARIGLPGGL